jgi:CheY-like chemotaxis protein
MATMNLKRIFVVEDNIENRVITQMALGLLGARVEFDRFGRDTLSKLHNFGKVDLIILDLMFPNGVTGYDIFDMIRSDSALAAVPIVAVSASDATTSIPRCQAKGFSGFIPKPIDIDRFPKQIEEIMNGHSVWQER